MTKKAKAKSVINNLTSAIVQIKKTYGPHAIVRASEMPSIVRIPSGIPDLDFSLGGGFPMGRIIHVYGRKHSGKTFLAMLVAAAVQKHTNGDVLWVDLENTFDSQRALQVGMDLSRTLLVRSNSAEEAFDIILKTVETEFIRGVVVDSIAAVAPKAEVDSEMEDQQMAAAPRVINKFFRKWGSAVGPRTLRENAPMLLLNNQRRLKFGGWKATESSPGGRGLGFFSSIEINISYGDFVSMKVSDVDDSSTIIGHDVKFKVDKNNLFPRGKSGKFLLCTRPYNNGKYEINANCVDWPVGMLKYGVFYGIIRKKGNTYTVFGKRLGVGKVAAQAAIYRDEDLRKNLYSKILEAIKKAHGIEQKEDTIKLKKIKKTRKSGSARNLRKNTSG